MGTHPCKDSFPQRSEGADDNLKKYEVFLSRVVSSSATYVVCGLASEFLFDFYLDI